MHVGLIVLFFVLVVVCGGPQAVLRAVSGLGCLIVIGESLLLLVWLIVQVQENATKSSASQNEVLPQ
jgi:hypothetical protein